jgi:hypothetical protein
MWQFVKRVVARVIYSIPLWLLLVLGVLAALQTTTVQTYLASHATRYLSDKIGYPIDIEYLNVRWPDYVVARNVRILDREQNRMIEVGELQVDFQWATLIDGKNIFLDKVVVKNGSIRLVRNNRVKGLNIDGFIAELDKLLNPPRKTKRKGPPPVFEIEQAWLNNVQFSFDDQRKDSIRDGFDYYHFAIDSIQGIANRLRFVADTIQTDIENLQGQDNRTNLDIHRLTSQFMYTRHSIALSAMKLDVGNSTLGESITFKYDRPADLGDFVQKVFMKASLRETRIYSGDLALFAPYLRRYEEYWSVNGDFNGLVGRFRLRNANLRFGDNSEVNGSISFEGLPNFRETLIDFDLKPSVIVAADLRQYLADSAAFRTARKFGTVRLTGKFLGFPQDFVANGTFDTDLGTVVSDVNLKLSGNEAKTAYEGRLQTRNFDIGTLTDRPDVVQRLDMDGTVEGTGLRVETASVRLKADINRIGYQFYDYRRIAVDGRLSRQQFDGRLAIRDTNLVFDADGEIDLRNKRNLVNIRADLQKADLRALKLSDKEAVVRTKLDVNIRGLEIDEIVGDAVFTEGNILYNGRALVVDSLRIHSARDSSGRVFNVRSDFADVDAEGNFDFTRLAADFGQLLKEYRLNFSNNAAETKKYYAAKRRQTGPRYRLDYNMRLKDVNPLLAMFSPGWYVSRNTQVEGGFAKSRTSIVTLHSNVDTLAFGGNTFYGNEIDINTSKLADSTDVLAATFLHSKRQMLGATRTENLTAEAIWNGKHIEFTGRIKQSNNTNYADLRGEVRFLPDRLNIRFKPSHFQAFENEWHIAANNLIAVQGRDVTFENMTFNNRYQSISVNGTLSDDTTRAVRLSLQDFGLESLNPLVAHQLSGVANGFVEITDFYRNRNVESELTVEELVVDKFLVGDVIGESHWNAQTRKINANYQVYRMDQRIVRLVGTYDPRAAENAMDMQAVLDRANLELLEPFLQDQVSRLGGTASGTLDLSGTLTAPVLRGEVSVRNGRFRYNYLNTLYYFDDKVYFSTNEIGVRNLQLRDEDDNVAVLNGGVFHDGFRNFVLGLRGRMRNFKVLNTTLKDNELFYGTAYVTGDMELLGSIKNLTIRADARSNKGTRIAIPISETRTVAQQDFIRFASKAVPATDTVALEKAKREQVNLSGVRMDFNFDLTPDAYCEIIFDEKAGDIIRGTGTGRIRMEIDTKGDFRMFGDYTIAKGAYNFTLLNAVNKAFNIEPGGTVSWTGDPYGGVLDISATYTQTASVLPIIPEGVIPEGQRPAELSRRYPVLVKMNLTGNLLSPKIGLGIDLKSFPQSSTYYVQVMDFQNRLAVNEQEMNRQVFSLLILQRLSSENFSGVGGQNTVLSSLSELLTNQLSYWASQVNENLEIDLNLNGLNSEAWNAFQLRLSYAALNGRLRITRDGGFTTVQTTNNRNNPNNPVATATAVSVIGDWTVEYMLNENGSLRVKMFNRNSQNVFNGNGIGTATTGVVAGFSLLHTESFDSLRELFSTRRNHSETPEKPTDNPPSNNEAQPSTSQITPRRRK